MSETPTPPEATTEQDPKTAGEVYAHAVMKLVRLHNLMIFVVFLTGLACLVITQQRGRGIEIPAWVTNVLVAVRILLPILALVLTTVYTSRAMDTAVEEEYSTNQIFNLYQRVRLLSMGMLTFAGIFAAVALVFGNTWGDLVLLFLSFGLLFMTRPNLLGFIYLLGAIKEHGDEIKASKADN